MTKNQWLMLTLDLYLPLTSFDLLMGGYHFSTDTFQQTMMSEFVKKAILTLDDHSKNMYKCVEHANQTKW